MHICGLNEHNSIQFQDVFARGKDMFSIFFFSYMQATCFLLTLQMPLKEQWTLTAKTSPFASARGLSKASHPPGGKCRRVSVTSNIIKCYNLKLVELHLGSCWVSKNVRSSESIAVACCQHVKLLRVSITDTFSNSISRLMKSWGRNGTWKLPSWRVPVIAPGFMTSVWVVGFLRSDKPSKNI